jgi:glycosyltransferase involved in cell wall biosynthesis
MIKFCKNDWISLLDVDDIWLPKKIELQLPYMADYDVIGTRCKYFGSRSGQPNIPVGNISNHNFLSVNPIINSSCLIKKELCKWDGKWDGVEDYDLWLKLWKQGKQFYNVESIQVMHRIHQESAFNAQGNHFKVNNLIKRYL